MDIESGIGKALIDALIRRLPNFEAVPVPETHSPPQQGPRSIGVALSGLPIEA
jgi:hypothetical protein